MRFPTPIGGTAFPDDFAPSVLFAVLYGLLSPLVFFRLIDRRSRTTLLIGTATFALERIVIYSLRAVQARSESKRISPGLLTYMQISFAMGYVGIANDMVNILRCLLVNTTFGYSMYVEQAPSAKDALLDAEDNTESGREPRERRDFKGWRREHFTGRPSENDPDNPRRRSIFRGRTSLGSLLFFAALVPGIIAHQHFGNLLKDTSKAESIYRLRYASSAVALFLIALISISTIYAYVKLPRVRVKAVLVMLAICMLTSTISIYRLAVMYKWTNSLLSTGSNTLNGPSAKGLFYVFHILPEWIASLVLLCANVRQLYGTGPFGDWRSKDMTEKERAKREEKKKKKAEKEGARPVNESV